MSFKIIPAHLVDRRFYLQEIKRDIAYYRRTYKRAHIVLDISGLRPGEASLRIKDLLMGVRLTKSRCPDVRPVPKPAGAFRFYLESVLVASGLCQSGSSGLTPLITGKANYFPGDEILGRAEPALRAGSDAADIE